MDKLNFEVMKRVADNSPLPLLIHRIEDDNIDNIKLIYANEASARSGSHVFPDHVGKKIIDIYEKSMVDTDFAQAWMRVSQTHVNEVHTVEYGGLEYDVHYLYVGDGCVATVYQDVTKD